jgi:hypothetical protein
MRLLLASFTLVLAASPLAAQQPMNADPDQVVKAAAAMPKGWHARTDSGQPPAGLSFVSMGSGFHATMGPAAIFFNDAEKHKGDYKVAYTFTQTKAPAHHEAFGLFIGGTDLETADVSYSYFLVRGTDEYFIATRKGAVRTVIQNWAKNPAIKPQDPTSGVQTNVLAAEVKGNDVIFTVNGVEVARRPKGEIVTDGLAGFRVNHNLDVHIEPMK